MKNKVTIRRINDLTSKIGATFIEFEIHSIPKFNAGISRECQVRVDAIHEETKILNETSDELFERSVANQTALSEYINRSKSINFLFSRRSDVIQLRQLIQQALSHFLIIKEKEYRGHRPNLIHSWPIVYKRKPSDLGPHIHSDNPMNISGVYYVCGDFCSDNGELIIYPKDENLVRRTIYLPKAGSLILFPASLAHALGKYHGHNKRISIAFDIYFKPDKTRNFLALDRIDFQKVN